MQTRRDLLRIGVVLPLLAVKSTAGEQGHSTSIILEDHCLAAESARGFDLLPAGERSARIVIYPARRHLTRTQAAVLQRQARSGAWVLLECATFLADPSERVDQAQTFRESFQIHLREPIMLPAEQWAGDYVRFTWPHIGCTRTFLSVTPLNATNGDVIAEWNGRAVAVKRRIGAGGVIVLGSLIGPGLLAHEREAYALARHMLEPTI